MGQGGHRQRPRHRGGSGKARRALVSLALCLLASPVATAQEPPAAEPPPVEPEWLVDGRWAWEPSTRIRKFTPAQVLSLVFSSVEGRPVLIDARGPAEYAKGHLPGAINVPHKQTWGRAAGLKPYDEVGIIYYGGVDKRAEVGTKGLRSEGFGRLGRMVGGYKEWQRLGYPVER